MSLRACLSEDNVRLVELDNLLCAYSGGRGAQRSTRPFPEGGSRMAGAWLDGRRTPPGGPVKARLRFRTQACRQICN